MFAAALAAELAAQGWMPREEVLLSGEVPPTAYAILGSPTDVVSDGVVSVRPDATLTPPQPVALYPQPTLLEVTTTDLDNYEVFRAYSVDGFEPVFSGPMRLTLSYAPADVRGDTTQLSVFRFDWDNGRWVSLPSVLDTAGNTVATVITERGMYAAGRPRSPTAPAIPPANRLLILGLVFVALVALGLWAWRRRLVAGPLALTLLSLLVAVAGPGGGRASSPQVTSPGGKPINHAEKIGAVERRTQLQGREVTQVCVSLKLWRFKGGTLDPTQESSWDKIPKSFYLNKKAVADDPGVPGATPVGEWDKDVDPFYDCAGYALRDSAYSPEFPWIDGKKILEDEYTCLGAATGGDYQVGDVVTYLNRQDLPVHYARVTGVDANGKITEVTSKWGKGRLMKHGLANVPPVYGTPHQVYRKR